MTRYPLRRSLQLLALFSLLCSPGVAQGVGPTPTWVIPLTVVAPDEVQVKSDVVTIGSGSSYKNGWDGAALEPVLPGSPLNSVAMRSFHSPSEP